MYQDQELFLLVGKLEPCLMQLNILKMRDKEGGAGRVPITVHTNGVGRIVGWGRGLPHGGVPILSARMPEPGGLSSRRGRGRGFSLPIPTIPPSTPPQPLGRGFPLPSSPGLTPPLEDCSPPRRHQGGPS